MSFCVQIVFLFLFEEHGIVRQDLPVDGAVVVADEGIEGGGRPSIGNAHVREVREGPDNLLRCAFL